MTQYKVTFTASVIVEAHSSTGAVLFARNRLLDEILDEGLEVFETETETYYEGPEEE